MRLFRTLKFITNHPANQSHRLLALRDYFRWQITSRLWGGKLLFDWIDGTKLSIAAGDTGLTGNVYTGLHEFSDMAFTLHFLRPGDQFFDIGANCGSYTILATGVIGAKTTAFEPLPETFARLRLNVAVNDLDEDVRIHNLGLGDQNTSLWFSSDLDTTNHVVEESDEGNKTKVPVRRLDEVVDCVPDLIKIDVEGFEINVFHGASRLLRDDKLKAMIVEVNESGDRYGNSATELTSLLKSYGFDAYRYDALSRSLHPVELSTQEANIIFVRDLAATKDRVVAARKIKVRSVEV